MKKIICWYGNHNGWVKPGQQEEDKDQDYAYNKERRTKVYSDKNG